MQYRILNVANFNGILKIDANGLFIAFDPENNIPQEAD